MKNRLFRTVFAVLAISAVALMVGCSKPDTSTAQDQAKEVDKGLEDMPPVPEELNQMSLSDSAAPPPKGGARGGGP